MKYTVNYDPEFGRTSRSENVDQKEIGDEHEYWAQINKEVREIGDPAVVMEIYAGEWIDTAFGKKQLYKIEKGGWIEHPYNLSQVGDCWIYGNAKVFGDARVVGNAQVYEGTIADGVICCDAEIRGSETKIKGVDIEIAGKIDNSEILDYVKVMNGGEVLDNSRIGLDRNDGWEVGLSLTPTIIAGKVEKSRVLRGSRVFGKIKGKCTIGYGSTICDGTEVEGKVLVHNAIVNGHVKEL